MKKFFIKFSTALILKYQVLTIEHTVVAYEFISPLMSIMCCSFTQVTYHHLPLLVENHKSQVKRSSLAVLSRKTVLFGMFELNSPQGGIRLGFIL